MKKENDWGRVKEGTSASKKKKLKGNTRRQRGPRENCGDAFRKMKRKQDSRQGQKEKEARAR